MEISNSKKLIVIEDAAQGILAYYDSKHLGGIGDMGTISFHETKNIICGEGGSLLIGNSRFLERAEVIRQKGTDRTKFLEGKVGGGYRRRRVFRPDCGPKTKRKRVFPYRRAPEK